MAAPSVAAKNNNSSNNGNNPCGDRAGTLLLIGRGSTCPAPTNSNNNSITSPRRRPSHRNGPNADPNSHNHDLGNAAAIPSAAA